ncbi:protocatechuate 3,4-dioxygenase subunit alpha [Streptomyces sp. NBC_01465]|uniref:protocatechuate 3,4-dioxygenase subunit alpha n=1 Tax=Streptomyces sp. NBC_01465 TaxID=2903878 RepID=UPI002E367922|nr:protocatechuate 3,4-dioxygenase subunit alpha [Streptomyces sp. NBC_01465]
MTSQLPTPSHTVGPFYGYALPFEGGGEMAPPGHASAITLHGCVYDGEGEPVPDALLEFWQGEGLPGSLHRNGVDFTGFGRVATDAAGHWTVHTLAPRTPYISVCVFARGLTHHLFTRAYVNDGPDTLLDALPPERRETLLAQGGEGRTYRFDIRLQGEGETVFLDFR